MKNRVKIATLYAIAFLLFIFGNAVNAVHFCCDVCRDQGAQVITDNLCHEHSVVAIHADNAKTDCETDIQHNPCSIERISIILDDFTRTTKGISLVHSLVSISGFDFRELKSLSSVLITSVRISPPVLLSGRLLLNHICVLRN